MLIRVQNGTNAGRRSLVDLEPWSCACGRLQPGARYSCGTCGTRRPSNVTASTARAVRAEGRDDG